MFPINDPQFQLDLHRQHVGEMLRDAESRRRARVAAGGRHRWFGRRRAPRATAI